MRIKLFFLSILFLTLFTLFSYYVAKEKFQKVDFDTTVKLQDKILKKFDDNFSLFSLLGSAEITVGFSAIMIILSLTRLKLFSALAWLMIIPASLAEIFGKLVLFHPGPPLFFHRTTLVTHLPSFYVHTQFSYPSGHMTRTIFIVTILCCALYFSRTNFLLKYFCIFGLLGFGLLMGLTRISLGEHWLSDVVGGSILGLAMGFFSASLVVSSKTIAKDVI